MNEKLQIIINTAKHSPLFTILSVVLILISSIITISSAISLARSAYSKTSIADKNMWLNKIEQLTPEANIEYFKQVIGSPVFINIGEKNTEYIFLNKYFFITAIADKNNKVISYSVTTRRKDFNPALVLGPYYTNTKPVKIILGKSKFSEIDKVGMSEPKIMTDFGAHTYHYDEEYYVGNPTNYQSFIFSINQSGYLSNDSFVPTSEKVLDLKNEDIVQYRYKTVINTYTITSPFVSSETLGFSEFGPTYDQVRVIPKFFKK